MDRICVTLPDDLAKKVREMADRETRNLSNMVSVLLKEALDKKAA